jgi:hypothetical protein
MATADDASDNYPAEVPGLTTVKVEVNGTMVMAKYAVVGSTLVLTSADFGDGSIELGGLLPEDVAVRLLRAKAEAAMARGGEPLMHDDEVNAPETDHGDDPGQILTHLRQQSAVVEFSVLICSAGTRMPG